MAQTKKSHSPQDVIVYVLANLEAGKRFTSRKSEIHRQFYEFSSGRHKNFNYLIKKEYFDGRICPYSKIVMRALEELQSNNLLVQVNPGQLEVSPALSSCRKDLEALFENWEIEIIRQMSKEFEIRMTAPMP